MALSHPCSRSSFSTAQHSINVRPFHGQGTSTLSSNSRLMVVMVVDLAVGGGGGDDGDTGGCTMRAPPSAGGVLVMDGERVRGVAMVWWGLLWLGVSLS